MTLKISEFLATVADKGLARQNRFEVIISNLFGSERLISLMCQTASLPGAAVQLKTQTLFGPAYFRPGTINYGGTLNLSFLCDGDMEVKKLFDRWIHTVINPSSFTVNYKDSYSRDVYINQLDEKENITYSVRLADAFPTQIGSLGLGQANLDRFHILPVTLSFRYWETAEISNNEIVNIPTSTTPIPLKQFNSRYPQPTLPPEPVDVTNIGAVGSAPVGSITTGGGSLSDLPIAP